MASRISGNDILASGLTFSGISPSPTSVLHVQTYPVPKSPTGNQVIVQLLAAPINPQDFLIVNGIYPIKPSHNIHNEPVPGYDGVGRVVGVGSQVTTLCQNDLVIPRGQGFGTWRTHALVDASECAKVPSCSDFRFAALLKMTVLPAYFLVEDLRTLKPGDWIIQTAGTSSIAQMVVQFAKLKGAHSISIIRSSSTGQDQSDSDTKKIILGKGADIVCTEEEFESEGVDMLKNKRVVLAIDCVWGKTAESLAKALPPNVLYVNFGNLSGGGPTALASFQHSSLFWSTGIFKGWKSTSSLAARTEAEFDSLTAWLVGLLESGVLKMPEYKSVAWALDQESDRGGSKLEARLLEAVAYAHSQEIRKSKVILEFRK